MTHRKALPGIWRRFPERYRLEGNKCKNCGEHFFPPRIICPNCRRDGKLEGHEMSKEGEIYSYTIIRSAPVGFEDQTPYVLAIIELKEGTKVTAQITDVDPEEMEIGMEVEEVLRKISEDGKKGKINYGYKFVPKS